jgi:hypothetical protein
MCDLLRLSEEVLEDVWEAEEESRRFGDGL